MKYFKIIFIFYWLVGLTDTYSQTDQVLIHGNLTNDSIATGNVTIINKSLKTGVISNPKGEFKILVKVGDTLVFSSLQFFNKSITIHKNHIKNKEISIHLIEKTNKLPEIVVQNMAKSLGLPNANKKPLDKLDRNLNAYSQKSTPVVFLDALLLGPILNNIPFIKQRKGSIDDIYNIVSGHRKKDRKLKKLIDSDKQTALYQEYKKNIRAHFKDEFFEETLDISIEKIDAFINYCFPKNIVYLFNKARYLEIMDIFIAESKTFKLIE